VVPSPGGCAPQSGGSSSASLKKHRGIVLIFILQ
jgi:hypothetical protein